MQLKRQAAQEQTPRRSESDNSDDLCPVKFYLAVIK